ncbi:MAG: ABC transporter ATP-binding protein [Chitinophagaceae bacterium]|nr:ABC transporter ATP-binding protein [Chitinophagaceae bacterium]
MSTPLLQVNNLSIDFAAAQGNTLAVNNISFEVGSGEIVAVVGESGSGKSVTALSLLQLLPRQAKISGQLLFTKDGNPSLDLLTMDEKTIRAVRGKDIAMIFQEPMTSLNPVFTCGYQVMEVIQLHQGVNKSTAKQKTIELFEKVQLPNPVQLISRYPHQLSGGQKQRVMIAMAMSCNPALLIADEPTTALDVTVQKTILELIKELQRQNGMSVVLITHDLGLVADIADKVVVMYRGKIIEAGNAVDVLKDPQQYYTKGLLRCRPSLHGKGERLPVVGEEVENGKWKEGSEERPTTNDQPSTILEVQDLKVHYPGKKSLFGKSTETYRAVDGVSFAVSKGETLGLVGESGCGKTTLGRAILQLIPATSGRIILNGIDLLQLPKKDVTALRKDLQIVFQDPYGSLNPRIAIGDAMVEPMQVHNILANKRERKDKVIELLEKVNLKADFFNRYPHQFSGGQRQRICIARSLALNPSFLIFDESVSALDVSVQAQVLNLLNDLKAEFGFTSIFISHDLSVVRYISDRIMVMREGKIVEEGLAEDIYINPKHEYTKRLIDAVPGKQLSFK